MRTLKWSSKILTGSALAVLLYTHAASAIELGAITLKSAASEPLVAEIAVTDVNGIDSSALEAQLASAEAFEQAGINREDYLALLDVSVTINAANNAIIKLTSEMPLDQPSIDILLQLQSPSETVLRRYLLSLGESAGIPINRRKQQLNASQHLVVVGDTLWNVSKRNRPRGLTILQTMDALYSQNPQAFVNGNANEMKEGAILRLPSTGDISQEVGDIVARQIGLVEEAEQQVAAPESMAKVEEVTADENVVPETDNQTPTIADANINDVAVDLKASDDSVETTELIVEDQPQVMVEQQASATELEQSKVAERLAVIDNKLLSTEDGISRTELENNELRERMALLEAQADTLVTSENLADQQQSDADTAAITVGFTFADLQAQLQRQPWYLWSGVALIVLVLGLLMRRPKSKTSGDSEEGSEAELPDDDQDYHYESSVDTGADLLVESQDGLKLNPEDELFDESDKEIFSEEDADVSPEIFDSMVEAAAEADVYLSLGNVDQAINILQQARAADANDNASRLKLMEILFREGRKDELQAIFLEIELAGDDIITAMAADIISSEQKAGSAMVGQAGEDTEVTPEEPSAEQEPSAEREPSAEIENSPVAAIAQQVEQSSELSQQDDDKVIDELAESVLDEDFLDDSFMDGGIFAEVSPASEPQPLEDDTRAMEDSASFEDLEPVQPREEVNLPGVDALQESMGAEADALADIAANLDQFENLEDIGEINSVEVKLDLAATYIEMGDPDGARDILTEIIEEADEADRIRARAMLDSIVTE